MLMTVSGVTVFVVGKIVKILLRKDGATIEIGFAYEGFPVSVEKLLMGFIRQQELMARG